MAISIGEIEATLRLRNEMTPQLQQALNSVRQVGAQMAGSTKLAADAFVQMERSVYRSVGDVVADLTKAENKMKELKKLLMANQDKVGFTAGIAAEMEQLVPKIDRLKKELVAAKKELNDTGETAKRTGANFQQLGTSLQTVGRTMSLYITAPIVAAGTAAVKFAADFETATTKINTLSGISRQEMLGMRDAMLKMAPEVGVGPNKLAEAMLAVTSTGIKGAQAMEILRAAAQAQAVGMGDATTVARTLTSIMQAYGETGITAAGAMEVMFKTVKDGNAEATQLAGSLGRVVGIASQVGVSFEEVGAFIATFTRLGVSSEEAVTSLRGTISEIIKPSKQAQEALAEVGLTFAELRQEIRDRGLMVSLEDLMERFHGNEDAVARVFPNIRALAGIMGTAGAQTEAYAKIQEHLTDKTHEFSDAMQETKQTLNFKWDALIAQLQAMAIVIGNELIPKITSFVDRMMAPGGAIDTVKEWIRWWNELPPAVRSFAETMLLVFAAGGPVLIGLGAVARAIGAIQLLLFGANTAAGMSVVGVLTGPIGKFIMGSAVMAGGFAVGNSAMTRDFDPETDAKMKAKLGIQPIAPGSPATFMLPRNIIPNPVGIGANAAGFVSGNTTNGIQFPKVGNAGRTTMTAKEQKAWDKVIEHINKINTSILDPTPNFADLPGRLAPKGGLVQWLELDKQAERIEKIQESWRDPTPNFKDLPGRLPPLNPHAYDGFSFTGPEQQTRQRASTSEVFSNIANSFVQMAQMGKIGPVMQSVGKMFVNLNAARQAQDAYGGRFGVASGMFARDATRGERFASGIQSAAAIGQGAMDVWDATGSHRTRGGNAMGGMMAGAQAGAAFGPWGMAIGAAAGLVVGIIRGKPEWAKAADEIGRDFGVKVSDELGKAIAKDAKTLFKGDRQAAGLFNLDKIISEAGGVNTGNIEKFTGKLRDVFSMLEKGKFTLAQTAEVLDKNFGSMVEAATDKLGFLSDGMREIIELDRRMGTNSKAVSDYLKEQASVAVAATKTIISAAIKPQIEGWKALKARMEEANKQWDEAKKRGDHDAMNKADKEWVKAHTEQAAAAASAKKELENLGVIAVATFAAAMEAGKSFSEAIAEAGPALAELAGAFDALGISTDNVALKALMLQGTILEKNPDLVAGIGALGSAFAALSNMGMLNVDTFSAMEETGSTMYTRLQAAVAAAGGTTRDALLPMQDYLHKAEQAAKELGIPLDDNTQRLIDQSKELGIWKEAGKSANDKMLDAMNRIATAMDKLLEGLGLLPAAAQAAADGVPDNPFAGWQPPPIPDYPNMPGPGPDYNPDNTRTLRDDGSGGSRNPKSDGNNYHTGGIVDTWKRMHTGMAAIVAHSGLAPGEVPAILQTGESVLNRQATRMVGPNAVRQWNAGRVPEPRSAGGRREPAWAGSDAAAERPIVHVHHVYLDGKEVTNVVVEHVEFDKYGAGTRLRRSVKE